LTLCCHAAKPILWCSSLVFSNQHFFTQKVFIMTNFKLTRFTQRRSVKVTPRLMGGLLVATAALLAVTGAQAQNQNAPPYSSRQGAMYGMGNRYISVNIGQSDFSRVSNGTGLFSTDKNTTDYSINAGGYFYNSNFGMELGYTDFGSTNRAGGRTKADGINLSLIGRMPVSARFNILGKVGTLYGRTDVSSAAGSGITASNETGFDWTYGLGLEYAFNPMWSGVLQYDENYLKFSNSGRDRITALSLGIRHSF
jgi:OmpA-OmpF porin, OOP family